MLIFKYEKKIMNRNNIYTRIEPAINIKEFIVIILFFLASSCDILEKEPLDSLYEEDVFKSEELTTANLNYLYYLIMPGFSGTTNSHLSDESYFQDVSDNDRRTGTDYMYGRLGVDAVGDFSSTTYGYIRKINILIEQVQNGPLSEEFKNKTLGQALFLRAWIYWKLVNLYGGVPIIKNVQNVGLSGEIPDELLIKRNKTSECIDFIVSDLDQAFQYLPAFWEDPADYGRITRGATLAFKGRVLLFWASPQFNPLNKSDRWKWAYNANKMAIDTLTKDGYGLHPSFKELFIDCRENTAEAILVRVYDEGIAGNFYHSYDNNVRQQAEAKSGGGKRNQPTWQLVKAFPMIDGYPVDSATEIYPYNKNRFWVNRDPRFEYTIAYNTCTWPLSKQPDYRIWTYYYKKDGNPVSIEGTNRTLSGFYCRKYVNPNILKVDIDRVGTDWMEIRYAEVLLNFAECANELDGKAAEVRNALYRVRNERTDVKVGMDYIDINLDNRILMREIIMTERQIELAFENKRHWDLRRRNMFEADLGPHIKRLNGTRRTGWKIELNEDRVTPERFLSIRDQYDYSTAIVYNAYFKSGYEDTLDTESPIDYPQPQYSFYAIPQTNLDKNSNLEQTIYWGGTFNPLDE